VSDFEMTKSQRRVYKKGESAITMRTGPFEWSLEKQNIFDKYLEIKHNNKPAGDTSDYFKSVFLAELPGLDSFETRFYHGDVLVAVGLVDQTEDVLSSIYFYYDPDFAQFSLGVYSFIKEIELAGKLGLTYYYPGYFIKECKAMNYKAAFHPHTLINPHEGTMI
jgi:arginine-tRNA-protein transferase